ncbi:MAG: FMN-binding protein, partial [Lachnospiraceae bacterium]|nr:FMN-binding protein [Lachnospiraceae bacterium]
EAPALGELKDGVYKAQAEPDEKGNYGFVTVTVADGKVTSVVWDEMYGGASKAELAATGQYVMVEGNPTWKDQSESLGAYVVANQTTDGILNEKGYTDAVSGVSIYVGGFVDLTNQAMAQASATIALKDGVYTAQGTPDDKGNYGFVTVTVADGKVTSVVWDEMYGGESKAQLSVDGKYVMKPVWKTQSESLGAYVVENQTTAGIMNETGYTDAVSGVSIYVGGFVGLVDQAIAQANGQDGTYTVEGDKDDNGNYGFVNVTIEGGKVTNVVWDEMYGGVSKAQLSVEGKYVMKPVWKTQAESLGTYVVENQTTDGILNEKGYTDAVSGVSIYVGGFVDLANQAIAQASENGEVPGGTPAPAIDATKVDVVSGATFSSKAVLRAINEGFVYLRDFILNK